MLRLTSATCYFLIFCFSFPCWAQGLSSLSYLGGPAKTFLNISGLRQNNDRQERLSIKTSTPIYIDSEQKWIATGKYNHRSITPNTSGITDLYDIEAGLTYFRSLSDQKSIGLAASFGSASDRPFKATNVNTLNLNAIYSFPQSRTQRWTFVLNYSNNRPILNNIPLPYFVFSYTPSRKFRSSFGIPFASIFWQFQPKWSMRIFTVVPWVLKAQIAYKLWGPAKVFSGLNFSQQTYRVFDRSNEDDRLFYEDQKLFIGFKSPISRFLMAEIEFGNSFNRSIFQAENYTRNPDNPNYLDSSLYGKFSLSARF